MIWKKQYWLCACVWLILFITSCTAVPEVERATIVPRTPVHTPAPDNTPIHTAVPPTPFSTPTHLPTSTATSKATTITEPTPTSEPTSTSNLDGITQVAQWGRGTVYDLTYSADGRFLYIMSASGTYIHDLQDPNGIRQKFESDMPVLLSPDGETAVIGQEVRHLTDNQILFSIPVSALRAKFLMNGEVLAVRQWIDGEGTSIQIWDVSNGPLMVTLTDTQAVSLSPNDDLILTVGEFQPFHIYKWPELMEQGSFAPEVDEGGLAKALPVTGAISPDNKHFALAWEGYESWYTAENSVDIYDLQTGEFLLEIPSIEPWGYKEDITFSCDEPPFMFEGPGAPKPVNVEFSPDGTHIAITYNDNFSRSDKEKSLINIYRLADGRLVQSFPEANRITFSPDGHTAIISTVLGNVQVWSLPDFSVLHEMQGYTGPIRRIQFAPDGQTVAIEYFDKTRLQQLKDGALVAEYPEGRIAFAPDGKTLAVGYEDGQIEWRQLADNTLLNSFTGHTARVNDLVFLPSGDLVSVADDCTMYAWNIADGTKQLQFEDYQRPSERNSDEQIRIILNHLLVLPAGNMIAASSGYEVNVWQTTDGTLGETERLPGDSSYILFSLPGGEKINRLGNTPDMPLNFWGATNEALLSTFGGIASFAFSPDGTFLALGADERFVTQERNGVTHLWDTQTALVLKTLPSLDHSKVTAVAFSPDGRYLLVGSSGGIVTIWEMPDQ